MKIIFVANTSWYLYNFRKSTISSFVDEGYIVRCVIYDDEYKEELEGLGADCILGPQIKSGADVGSLLRLYKHARDTILHEAADVILTFTPKINILYGYICARHQCKYIMNISGQGFLKSSGNIVSNLLTKIYKYLINNSHHTFTQNSDDDRYFRSLFSGEVANMTRIIGSGVDLEHFGFTEIPDVSKIRFGIFCRMLKPKGISEFLESAKIVLGENLYNCEFVCAGRFVPDHPAAFEIAEMQEYTSIDGIEYLGDLSDPVNAMQECHFIVLPTYYGEGMPKSLLEAAALGRGVITTNTAGASEAIMEEQTGFFVEEKCVQSLTNVFRRVLALDENEVRAFGHRARDLAFRKFSDGANIAHYLQQVRLVKKSSVHAGG